ncbi:MAG: hypothetical protein KAF91_19240 [Nostoc sp. TH1S01]|nr:hypothetical protein [Nostoc sp. TH1S01]
MITHRAIGNRGYTDETPPGSPVACGGKPSRSTGLTTYVGWKILILC